MIKAVCLALDNVYFLNGRVNFIVNLSKQGADEEEAKRIFVKSDIMNKIYKLGKISDEKYWDWAMRGLGLQLTADEAVNLLISGYELNEPVAEHVKNLRTAGYKTLICSNSFQARIEGLQHRFNFLDEFDNAVFSYQRGVDKPNKEIFDTLVEQSQLPANEIVYFDDNEGNLKGAADSGITTFVYSNYETFAKNLEEVGVKINV